MSAGRFTAVAAALFGFSLAWNAFWHLGLLARLEARLAPLHRPPGPGQAWPALALMATLAVLFLAGHLRWARSRSLAEGARYGLWFALVAGLLVDFNQYLIYPLPGGTVLLWFLGGLAEFIVAGLVASALRPRS